jgi:hypothetical protein
MAVKEHPRGMDLPRPLRHWRQGIHRFVRPGDSPLPRAQRQKGGQTTLDNASMADPPNRGPTHSHGRSFSEFAGARCFERVILLADACSGLASPRSSRLVCLGSGNGRRMRQCGETSRDTCTGRVRAQHYTEVARAIPSPQEENQAGKVPPLLALRRPGAQALCTVQEMLRAAEEMILTRSAGLPTT